MSTGRLIDRPRRYENIDGTLDMFFGVFYLGGCLQGYVGESLPEGSHWTLAIGSMLLIYPIIWVAWWGQRIIKRRITWPRTGYVKERLPEKSRMWKTWAALAVVAVAMWLFLRASAGRDLTALARPFALFLLAAPCLTFLLLLKEPAWKWLAALVLAAGLGVLAWLVPGDVLDLLRPAMLFTGMYYLASGLITFCLYLRRNRPPVGEPE